MRAIISVSDKTGVAEFYSEVVVNFGEPHTWQVYVAVNPDTGKAVFVQENPFRTGPTPPKTNG